MRASRLLDEMALVVQDLGRSSSEDVLVHISRTDERLERTIRMVLNEGPRGLLRVISETAAEAFKRADDGTSADRVIRTCFDPRSFREASAQLRRTAAILKMSSSPGIDEIVGNALEILEQRGALGGATLLQLARFLSSVRHHPESLEAWNRGARSRDEVLDNAWLHDAATDFQIHDPQWVTTAVDLAMGGGSSPARRRAS